MKAFVATAILAALTLSTLIAQDKTKNVDGSDESAKDSNEKLGGKLEGEWKFVGMERNGKAQKSYYTKCVFRGNKWTLYEKSLTKGNLISSDTIHLKKTGQFDIWGTRNGKPGKTGIKTAKGGRVETVRGVSTKAIFAVNGDELKICEIHQRKTEMPRPTEFKTKKGDSRTLYILKRVNGKP